MKNQYRKNEKQEIIHKLHIITNNQIIYGNHSYAYSSLQKIYSEASGLFTSLGNGFLVHMYTASSVICWEAICVDCIHQKQESTIFQIEKRINNFFLDSLAQKGQQKLGTKPGQARTGPQPSLGGDYSRRSALFAFSIEFLFSHSYSQACTPMGTTNRRHRLHVCMDGDDGKQLNYLLFDWGIELSL